MGQRTESWEGECTRCRKVIRGGGDRYIAPSKNDITICLSCFVQERIGGTVQTNSVSGCKGPKMVEYGIQTEASDYRLHVCFCTGLLYLFPRFSALEMIESDLYPKAFARQPGVDYATGQGYLLPCDPLVFPDLVEIEIPTDIMQEVDCRLEDSLVVRGQKAERVVRMMFERKLVQTHLDLNLGSTNQKAQIEGIDFITRSLKHQVKCDFKGGPRERGGTGNLFIQTAELNPFKLGRRRGEKPNAYS